MLVLTPASSELRQHSDKHKLPVCADKWLKRRQMMRAFRLPRSWIHSETKRGNSRKITESRVNRNATGLCCHIWTRNHNICPVPTRILWLCQIKAMECIKPFLFGYIYIFNGCSVYRNTSRYISTAYFSTFLSSHAAFLDSLHDLPTGLFSPSREKINNINKPERSCVSFQILKAV